jgi:hypothetical protein
MEDQVNPGEIHPFEPGRKPARAFETNSLHTRQHSKLHALRMYTEEEVSEMLQVSLSQLRKWRMKNNQSKDQGPPFKKIGRLVRYPEQGLMDYINQI